MSPDRACAKIKSRGFTLIELMVVVFIIGILIAAVLVGVPKIKRAVYGAQTQAQLSALAGAIQQYYNDYKAYPGPLANNQLASTFAGASGRTVDTPTVNGIPLTTDFITNPARATLNTSQITGAENLVLGLCGGLRFNPGTAVAGGSGVATFSFYLNDIYGPDGVTPAPKGPSSLNPNLPKKQTAYITLKPGDISVAQVDPSSGKFINGGLFTDSAGRSAGDSMIPEFMDKYADPLPILYYRANVGGTAIVGLRKFRGGANIYVDDSNNQLMDTSGGGFAAAAVPETAQYDLVQNLGYVKGLKPIGVIANNPNSIHGLQGVGLGFTDPIDVNNNGTFTPPNNGKNGIAYFKDPTLNDPVNSTNIHQGTPRQKDGYVLISAGADRQYGTHDDQIFPGPLVPAQ